jgi:hypothetical protein
MSAGAKVGDGKSTSMIKGRLIRRHLYLNGNRMICNKVTQARFAQRIE